MSNQDADDTRATVLVVDDETEVADLYADRLGETYETRTAYSGERALDLLDSTVDVVLLDRRMPELTGDDVLEEIRARNVGCRVVIVTAIEPDVDLIGMDFDEYLVKPVTEEDLHDVVERMLARKRHDEVVQEAIAIASKMATLESKMDLDDLEEIQEYKQLEARFAELRDATEDVDPEDDLYTELTRLKMQAMFDAD